MKPTTALTVSLAWLVLGACSSPPESPAMADGAAVACTRTATTGSTIVAVRCRTPEQQALERQAAEAAAAEIRRSVPATGNASRP